MGISRTVIRTVIKSLTCLSILLILVGVFSAGAFAAPAFGDRENGKEWKNTGANASDGNYNLNESKEKQKNVTQVNVPLKIGEAREKERAQNRYKDQLKDKLRERDRSKEEVSQYRLAKEELQNKRQEYKTIKENFIAVRAQVRAGKLGPDSPEAFNAAQNYMVTSIDYMIAHLKNVRENLNNSNGKGTAARISAINEQITLLEKEKKGIKDASSQQDLFNSVKSARGVWNNARKDANLGAGETINNRIASFLEKSRELSKRLESEIKKLKEEGRDTKELESKLLEYKSLIEEAKKNQELANVIYQKENSSSVELEQAETYLRKALKSITPANRLIKEVFDDLKEYRPGKANLSGEEKLFARGNGTVVLSGDINVSLSAKNARLTLKDLAGDATKTFEKEGPEISADDKENGTLVYNNVTGNVTLSGSRLIVVVRGEKLSITAEGTGSARLSGTGKYSIEKASSSSGDLSWAPEDKEAESAKTEASDNSE